MDSIRLIKELDINKPLEQANQQANEQNQNTNLAMRANKNAEEQGAAAMFKKHLDMFGHMEENAERYEHFFVNAFSVTNLNKKENMRRLKAQTYKLKNRSHKRRDHHAEKMNGYSASLVKDLKIIHIYKNDQTPEAIEKTFKARMQMAMNSYKYQMHFIREFGTKEYGEKEREEMVLLAAITKQRELIAELRILHSDIANQLRDYIEEAERQIMTARGQLNEISRIALRAAGQEIDDYRNRLVHRNEKGGVDAQKDQADTVQSDNLDGIEREEDLPVIKDVTKLYGEIIKESEEKKNEFQQPYDYKQVARKRREHLAAQKLECFGEGEEQEKAKKSKQWKPISARLAEQTEKFYKKQHPDYVTNEEKDSQFDAEYPELVEDAKDFILEQEKKVDIRGIDLNNIEACKQMTNEQAQCVLRRLGSMYWKQYEQANKEGGKRRVGSHTEYRKLCIYIKMVMHFPQQVAEDLEMAAQVKAATIEFLEIRKKELEKKHEGDGGQEAAEAENQQFLARITDTEQFTTKDVIAHGYSNLSKYIMRRGGDGTIERLGAEWCDSYEHLKEALYMKKIEDLFFETAEKYNVATQDSSGWLYATMQADQLVKQGWKLHVSFNSIEEFYQKSQVILPVLMQKGINFKIQNPYAYSKEKFSNGNPWAKQFTIYADSTSIFQHDGKTFFSEEVDKILFEETSERAAHTDKTFLNKNGEKVRTTARFCSNRNTLISKNNQYEYDNRIATSSDNEMLCDAEKLETIKDFFMLPQKRIETYLGTDNLDKYSQPENLNGEDRLQLKRFAQATFLGRNEENSTEDDMIYDFYVIDKSANIQDYIIKTELKDRCTAFVKIPGENSNKYIVGIMKQYFVDSGRAYTRVLNNLNNDIAAGKSIMKL